MHWPSIPMFETCSICGVQSYTGAEFGSVPSLLILVLNQILHCYWNCVAQFLSAYIQTGWWRFDFWQRCWKTSSLLLCWEWHASSPAPVLLDVKVRIFSTFSINSLVIEKLMSKSLSFPLVCHSQRSGGSSMKNDWTLL